MRLSYTHKKNILFIIFLGWLSLSLLSPIASNEYIPNTSDFNNHVVNIIQAKQALDEGQFPVRVGPSLYQGWHYAYYQFYSPFVYTVAGAVYKWLTPENPFLAFKVTLWFFLLISGWYVFRLIKEWIHSESVALLTSVVFLMAPYLVIDLGLRGDLTESLAACVVPIVLYYNLRFQRQGGASLFFCVSLAWFVLATTHILVFLCSMIFIGLFITSYNIQESIPLKRLFFAVLAFFLSILLGLWYFVPLLMVEPYLYTQYILSNPMTYRWLNPLPTLLSASPVSPMPMPGNGLLNFPFYISVGWPVLLSAGFILYKKITDPQMKIPSIVMISLCLFFLGLFIIWSPINFWKFFPQYSKAIQFSYRLMVQMLWLGALLFAWTFATLFQNKIDKRHVVIGILLIAATNGAWVQTNPTSKLVSDIVHSPKLMEWGASSFVVRPDFLKENVSDYLPVDKTQAFCHRENTVTYCNFDIIKQQMVQLPLLFYPNMLDITVNGQAVSYKPIPWHKSVKTVLTVNPMLASIELPPGRYTITAQFTGVRWANTISVVFGSLLMVWASYIALSHLLNFLKASLRFILRTE